MVALNGESLEVSYTPRIQPPLTTEPSTLGRVPRPPLEWPAGNRWQAPRLRRLWAFLNTARLVETLCGELGLTLGAVLCAGILYWLLHQRYYISYVDDAWCVSQAHLFFLTGRSEDYLFRLPNAPDRVLVFARTYFYLYGGVLSRLGWTKSHAHVLSSLFIWFSAVVWVFICRRLNLSPTQRKLIPVSILLLPAYFSAGNLARYDALVFFLSSLTFLCFLDGRHFLTGLLLIVAMETHPLGVTGAFYILADLLAHPTRRFAGERALRTAALRFAAGATAGMAYAWGTHSDVTFERLLTTLAVSSDMEGFRYGFIVKYFTQTYWYRDVWELPLIAGAIALFIRHRMWTRHRFAAIFLATMILESFAISRPNANYMLVAFPAISLLMFVAFEERQLLGTILPVMGVALVAVYGTTYGFNRSYDFNRVVAETRASLVDERIPVIGMPDNWFAVPERTFYPIYHSVRYIPSLGLREFYLIRNDYLSSQSHNYYGLIASLEKTHECESVRSFTAFRDGKEEVFHCVARSDGAQAPQPR